MLLAFLNHFSLEILSFLLFPVPGKSPFLIEEALFSTLNNHRGKTQEKTEEQAT